MVKEDHALQRLHIVRILRVLAGQFKLQHTAAGDLRPLEGQLQAVHIVGQFRAGKLAVRHLGDDESSALGESLIDHRIIHKETS